MIGASSVDVERKVNAILRVLRDSPEAVGARVIGRQLAEQGIVLSERAVRYHLKLMDERGLTQLVGRDGRQITEAGLEELRNALVGDKVGLFINRIGLVSFQTTFDWKARKGSLPANLASPTARHTFAFNSSRRLKLTNPQLPRAKARIFPPVARARLISSSLSPL